MDIVVVRTDCDGRKQAQDGDRHHQFDQRESGGCASHGVCPDKSREISVSDKAAA